MNELNFSIGFIIGSLFTTALMFIIKKIFFNFSQSLQFPDTQEIKKRLKELENTKTNNQKTIKIEDKNSSNTNINTILKPIDSNNEIDKNS